MVSGQWPRRRWRETPGCEDCQALLNCSDYLVLIVAWWGSAVGSVIREAKPTFYAANDDESMDHPQGSKQLQPSRELTRPCCVAACVFDCRQDEMLTRFSHRNWYNTFLFINQWLNNHVLWCKGLRLLVKCNDTEFSYLFVAFIATGNSAWN